MSWSLSTLSKKQCNLPVLNIRRTPSEDAEVVSQLLLAEQVQCLEESGLWTLIQMEDGYRGWVYSLPLVDAAYQTTMVCARKNVPLYTLKSILRPPLFHLPFGVGVKVIDSDSDWHTVELPGKEICYICKGNLSFPVTLNKKDLYAFCRQFLEIPYLWGGRSSFGYDCSGLVQMLYRQMGILIPRDSGPQSQDAHFIDIEYPRLGDLIFWGHSRNNIAHVALSLGEDQFIHATVKEHQPWVRISSLTDLAWNCGVHSSYPFRCFKTLG